ncbi:type III-A CRISPR-associated RAMP protein Csm5 [bacterium]|nr:type III-A CRISPR-associated RAMP protein Csm5 [bacterium]
MYKHYTANAEILLPVHVGGGSEYALDPLEYAVKDGWLYHIDLGNMLASDGSFAKIFIETTENDQSIVHVRTMITEAFNPDIKDNWRFRTRVSSQFEQEFKKKLSDIGNQLIVQCMLHEAGYPVIPGSSIKGSIRTAILNGRADANVQSRIKSEMARVPRSKQSSIAEGKVLSAIKENRRGQENFDIKADPFKGVKISDAILPADSTIIVNVQNVSIHDEATGIPMWVEAIKPGTTFTFDLSLLSVDNQMKNKMGINAPLIGKNDLLTMSTAFYSAALQEENEKFYQNIADSQTAEEIDTVISEIQGTGNETGVLRLGRFSHLESMTFNGPLRMPNHAKGWGNTRNLMNGMMPMGVVKFSMEEK